MENVINVEGMSCSHCEKAIINALTEMNGVSNVKVSLEAKKVTVTYDDSKISLDSIKNEILDIGYEVV